MDRPIYTNIPIKYRITPNWLKDFRSNTGKYSNNNSSTNLLTLHKLTPHVIPPDKAICESFSLQYNNYITKLFQELMTSKKGITTPTNTLYHQCIEIFAKQLNYYTTEELQTIFQYLRTDDDFITLYVYSFVYNTVTIDNVSCFAHKNLTCLYFPTTIHFMHIQQFAETLSHLCVEESSIQDSWEDMIDMEIEIYDARSTVKSILLLQSQCSLEIFTIIGNQFTHLESFHFIQTEITSWDIYPDSNEKEELCQDYLQCLLTGFPSCLKHIKLSFCQWPQMNIITNCIPQIQLLQSTQQLSLERIELEGLFYSLTGDTNLTMKEALVVKWSQVCTSFKLATNIELIIS